MGNLAPVSFYWQYHVMVVTARNYEKPEKSFLKICAAASFCVQIFVWSIMTDSLKTSIC